MKQTVTAHLSLNVLPDTGQYKARLRGESFYGELIRPKENDERRELLDLIDWAYRIGRDEMTKANQEMREELQEALDEMADLEPQATIGQMVINLFEECRYL